MFNAEIRSFFSVYYIRIYFITASLVITLSLTACSYGVKPVTVEAEGNDKGELVPIDVVARIGRVSGSEERNELIMDVVRLSNIACNRYTRTLNGRDVRRNLLFNGLSVLTGSIAPLFNRGATEILAVTSGTSTAINSEITADVFQNQTFLLLFDAIKREREQKLSAIKTRFKETTKDYSAEEAMMDVDNYHSLCSMRAGLNRLVDKNSGVVSRDQLTASADTLDKEIEKLRAKLKPNPALPALTSSQVNQINKKIDVMLVEWQSIITRIPHAAD